jgi:nucleoside-diphosphate-sugar epimerase
MRVLVTGGLGRIGQALIADLLANGHSAVCADQRRPDARPEGYTWMQVDLTDVGQVAGAMTGCDAVVHLGAIPTAYENPDEVVFRNNTSATFAVLQASALLGIKQAVIASTLAVIGTPYAKTPTFPLFAPIDESHPIQVQDPYGLSKEVDERTAEMFVRRYGMDIAAMRFALVAAHSDLRNLGARLTEKPGPGFLDRVLWAYVDVRDAARICRMALETRGYGFQAFCVSADDMLCDGMTEDLIRTYSPATEIRRPIVANGSALSTAKARGLLGWTPIHSWKDEA